MTEPTRDQFDAAAEAVERPVTTTETTETETTVETPDPVLVPDGPSTRVELPATEVTETTTTETTSDEPEPS